GNIEYLGRIDHQVKIRGYRIECGEVETRLMEHEAVREAVVMSKSDQREQAYLCAYYVSSEALSVAELRAHLATLLPEYMIPAYFVHLNQMPLSPSGKIDRKALPKPDYSFEMEQQTPPSNEYEVALLDIWRDVIGRQHIGVNGNFFEIGGNSILLIQVHGRLSERFPDLLSIVDLFAYPTIRQLARHIENLLSKEQNTFQLSPIRFSKEVFTNGAYTPGDTVEFRLTELQVNYIMWASKQSGVDTESVLLALFLYLFSEYANTDQVSVACMSAPDIAVPIAIDLSSISNLHELFNSVGKQKTNSGFRVNRSEWQHMRLERLGNELYAAFTTSKNSSTELNRIFNLVVRLKQSGKSISLQWDYDSGKMQLHTIHSWIRSYSDLISLSMAQYLRESEEKN
ncbi:phosphopantetheine-binding protein, partial [Paenibacillus terrae]